MMCFQVKIRGIDKRVHSPVNQLHIQKARFSGEVRLKVGERERESARCCLASAERRKEEEEELASK